MGYPAADPIFDEAFEEASSEAARYGVIVSWLERVERTFPVQPGNEMGLRNLSRLRQIVAGWKDQAVGLEVRLRTPED